MSGHSKWSTIKRKKGEKDGARAKVFTKISREIIVAIKEGGGDPNNNAKLATLIQKAKSNNIPNDNIDRLIKKAAEKRTITKTVYTRATVLTVLPLSLIALPTTETEQQAKSVTTLTSSAAIWVQAAVYRSCSA